MKRGVVIIVFLAFAAGAYCQVKHDVVASAGGYATAGQVSVSWTLGETVVPTQQNGDVILTNGFQQQIIISTLERNLKLEVEVLVYPNPAADVLNIRFGSPLADRIDIIVLDQSGRLVKSDFAEASVSLKELNLQDLASGIYYLKLVKGKISNVYKVVKL